MKFAIVLACLLAVAVARPDNIVRQHSDVDPHGFKFGVETSDGSSHDAEGTLKDVGTEHAALIVHGKYTWKDKHGEQFTVEYTADEHGYHPVATHLPH